MYEQFTRGHFEKLTLSETTIIVETQELFAGFVKRPVYVLGPFWTEHAAEVLKGGHLLPARHKLKAQELLTFPELHATLLAINWREQRSKKDFLLLKSSKKKLRSWRERGWFVLEDHELDLFARVRVNEIMMFKGLRSSVRLQREKNKKTPLCELDPFY